MKINFVICKKILLLFTFSATCQSKACICPGTMITAAEYRRSDLVIQGRIIDTDTLSGKESNQFMRNKIVIERKFKVPAGTADTIFVLTDLECGYPFTPFTGVVDESFYRYIIYADQMKIQAGKAFLWEDIQNTFVTERCRRIQPVNKEEIGRILKWSSTDNPFIVLKHSAYTISILPGYHFDESAKDEYGQTVLFIRSQGVPIRAHGSMTLKPAKKIIPPDRQTHPPILSMFLNTRIFWFIQQREDGSFEAVTSSDYMTARVLAGNLKDLEDIIGIFSTIDKHYDCG